MNTKYNTPTVKTEKVLNATVESLYDQFELLLNVKVREYPKLQYEKEERIRKELAGLTRGYDLTTLSKDNIVKLIKMQSSLRFAAHHTFYLCFDK